mmetsp:Transcript_15898/g.26628  ORF Transcript_15898/g.26628 Transcript_15898/m.26628 type:complete len:210 (-) Transcript_15898:23-652(-)
MCGGAPKVTTTDIDGIQPTHHEYLLIQAEDNWKALITAKSDELDAQAIAHPYLPYLWGHHPLPVDLYVDGQLPEGCIAFAAGQAEVHLTPGQIVDINTERALEVVPNKPNGESTLEELNALVTDITEKVQARGDFINAYWQWSKARNEQRKPMLAAGRILFYRLSANLRSEVEAFMSAQDYPSAWKTLKAKYQISGVQTTRRQLDSSHP